jgi:hypothetical protein
MNVQSLLESANPFQDRQAEAGKLVGKWEKTGLLKNLNSEYDRNNMAVILENQAKALVQEANVTGGQSSMSGGAGENWAGVALPLVRRVFGEIVAKEFVSVQPMSLPSGLVFYLDFKYSNLGLSADGAGKKEFGTTSLYGNQAENHPNVKNLEVAGGLYGDGRYGYSINTTQSVIAGTSASALTLANWNYNSAVSASVGSSARSITFASGALAALDTSAVKSIAIVSGSTLTADNVLNEFSTLNADGTVTVIISGSVVGATGSSQVYQVYYPKTTTVAARGDFEDASGAGYPNAESSSSIAIPSIDIKLKSESIVAKTRKLKAQWTPEFAQDLNAYHSVDAESEVTSMLSNYIAMEVDLELLGMLQENAATTGYWSAANNTFWNGSGFTTVSANSQSGNLTGYYNSQGEWFQTIGTVLQQVSNKIHQKTLRGGANFMVCSPAIATVLESIPGFATDGDGEKSEFGFGIQKIGSLNSRYKVYKNPYLTSNMILMGYKGSQFLETGAVYAPYIPLIMTPLVYDPETFTPRKGLMTRYAKKMVRPEFYGRVFVHGLETLGY